MTINPVSIFFTKFKLYILGGVIVSAIAGSAYLGWHVQSLESAKAREKERIVWQLQADKQREADQLRVDKERDRLDGIAAMFEAKLETLRPVYKTINQRVEKEVLTNTIYSDLACAIPSSGIAIMNQNVMQLNATRSASK